MSGKCPTCGGWLGMFQRAAMPEATPPEALPKIVYLCRANGEGSHEFRVCADEAGVMAFYEAMFGRDMDGNLDYAIEHFRDTDNWSNEGTAYHCELYCATFEVWKTESSELALTASPLRLKEE